MFSIWRIMLKKISQSIADILAFDIPTCTDYANFHDGESPKEHHSEGRGNSVTSGYDLMLVKHTHPKKGDD